MKFPEHEKLKEVQTRSQAIHEFLEFAQEKHKLALAGYIPCDDSIEDDFCDDSIEDDFSDQLYYTNKSVTALVAEFFEIDLNKIEKEKEQMIEIMRGKA